jgi:hypothetical protein
MTRALSGRVEKLEAKRRMHDDDLTRLSREELNARIEALTAKSSPSTVGSRTRLRPYGRTRGGASSSKL